jgi:nucleotide-binding universal stress UspA family protein
MIMLNSVVVAFDFGETSTQALRYGHDLARTFGGRLYVLHVADVISPTAKQFYPEETGDPKINATKLALKYLREVLVAEGAEEAQADVRLSPNAAETIVDYAKDLHADVIVVGTHGRSGVSRLLMGSVAEHVVRSAPCPVLVVRPREHEFSLPEPVSTAARV